MKNMKNFLKAHALKLTLSVFGLAALATVDNGGGCVMAMGVIAGVAGGKHVMGEPLTVALTQAENPDFLVNEIDRRIVKIRPMATPIDQLSRWAGAKRAGSMVVDYYSVDTRPTTGRVAETFSGVEGSGSSRFQKAKLTVDKPELFELSETLLVKGVGGYKSDGTTPDSQDLVVYVMEKDDAGITVVTVNGKTLDGYENCIPTISEGTTLVRMWAVPQRSLTCRRRSLRPCR